MYLCYFGRGLFSVIGIILSDRASFDRALSLFCLTFLHYGMRVFFYFWAISKNRELILCWVCLSSGWF